MTFETHGLIIFVYMLSKLTDHQVAGVVMRGMSIVDPRISLLRLLG